MRAAAEPDRDDTFVSPALAAIERERYVAYSIVARNLHWLAAALVLLYAVLHHRERMPLYLLAGVMVLYTLALHWPRLGAALTTARVSFEATLDLAWVTGVVLASGGVHSPLYFLYYMGLFTTLPASGRWLTYAKASAITVATAAMALVRPAAPRVGSEWSVAGVAGEVVWPLAGLWLVAYFAAEAGSVGAHLHRSLFMAAHIDELTGLPNMRYFTTAADLRGHLGQPYTIVMADADHLKRVNDTYGHAQGSLLIQRVADALRSGARSGDDLCSRLGGDEFIVRLGGASADGALAYCRRVRRYLEEHPLALADGTRVPISISLGLASFPAHGRNLSEVTAHADQALYESKRQGRGSAHLWASSGIDMRALA
jgi:diguanylate cyclase (GGDEF)-like protein